MSKENQDLFEMLFKAIMAICGVVTLYFSQRAKVHAKNAEELSATQLQESRK